jgi:hypothetical protein
VKKIILLFVSLTLLNSCAVSTSTTVNSGDEALAIISRYVAGRKGWRSTQYRIDTAERRGRVAMYIVVYLEDEKKAIPGGGKSFEVEYDRSQKRVVREWGLQ